MAAFFLCLSSSFFSIIIFLILLLASAEDDVHFTNCAHPFDCGRLPNIAYPFWTDDLHRPAYCGNSYEGFKLKCIPNLFPSIIISSQIFQLLRLNQSRGLMTIQRVLDNGKLSICPKEISINEAFNYSDIAVDITLCRGSQSRVSANHNLTCKSEPWSEDSVLFFKNNETGQSCDNKVEVPVGNMTFEELKNGTAALKEALLKEFDIKYYGYDHYCRQCEQSGGRCGSNITSPAVFACYCPDGSHLVKCVRGSDGIRRKLIIGIASAGISLLIVCLITICFKRKTLYHIRRGFLRKLPKMDQDIEDFLRINGTLGPKRYSYSDIRKMTNSFKEQLGKGGYGSVYKGKLPDGRLVAVKMLDTSKGNGQEFINEVASISRTSHVNIVNLLGFCLEGQKRALIYEFMPNGSLERFIYKGNTNLKDHRQLKSEELYRIAIGIARGLEYLHRGCNTRIVHFDIKPHNILLDENFSPKISDFGLAKLCTTKESFVSMMEARGTIGYIAPEVFCRNIGGVSHKSDVYSYGMMVLEMAGGRRNIDVGVSQTSEIYFPHWIYKHLDQQGSIEPDLLGLMTIEESEIARKMILVGLWCIQTNPPDRPSISKVIEMFEGSIEALQLPPKPYLSSPPRAPVDSTS